MLPSCTADTPEPELTEPTCVSVFQRKTQSSTPLPFWFFQRIKNVQYSLFLILPSEQALTQLLAERLLKGTAFL